MDTRAVAHTESLNILVFGAGAIGTYIGGSLALQGQRVVFLEQPTALTGLRTNGLHLDLTISRKAAFDVRAPSVLFEPSLELALRHGPFDFAIFALKSFDTAAALEAMSPFAAELPVLLCLSNGVDNEPALAAVLGPDKVIAGTVTSSVGRLAAGNIVLERLRGVGVADKHPLSLFVAETLNAAGLNARLFMSTDEMKWSKMLTNLPANASAAILDLTPAEIFAHPGLFALEIGMLREALRVMKAQSIRVVDLPGTPVRLLALGMHLPAFISHPLLARAIGGGRGAKLPSFSIALRSGRGKSEVDWLNGAVVRAGQRLGIPTPLNKLLTDTLLALTHGELPLETYARQPEKFLEKLNK